MELHDSVIVVTGGASGIGAAMCRRFADESPRHVRVVDRDLPGAEDVAASLRARGVDASATALDVTDRGAVEALIDEVRRDAGPIDLFCANAGIGTGAGADADDDVWEQAWQVNVHAHVLAARALLPHWLERGHGYLLTTASAAGLLTNLGDAPYSVTKHAAVAFAEWLSITYGDRGVTVSCLCPQGVRTPLLFGALGDGALATEVVKAQRILEPEEVAESVVEALHDGRFLILPHAEVADYELARASDRERWLRAMRRLQASLGTT